MKFDEGTWWLITLLVGLALGIIGYFLKRTMSKQDSHDADITNIKLTYVTKDDLKEVKSDFERDTSKLQKDVEQIKETCLTKKDFYANQNRIEQKIDKQNELILELLRGGNVKA